MNTIEGDLNVTGNLLAGGFTLPNNSVGSGNVKSTDPLDQTKTKPRYCKHALQQGTVVTLTQHLHVAHAAGAIEANYRIALITPCIGDSTVSVSIHKNGVNITGTPAVLSNANAAYANVSGSISPGSVSYVAGDVFTAVVTATVGTGTLGANLVVSAQFKENIP